MKDEIITNKENCMEIHNKYKIEHTDGTPLKGKKYFVLRLDSDDPMEAARVDRAMRAYMENPRNCDVGSVKEQTERFGEFCENNMQYHKDMFGDGLDGWDCKEDCPIGRMIDCEKAVADRCQLAWAQMQYSLEKQKEI